MTDTARQRLLKALTDERCFCGATASCPPPEQYIDAYAHELAEKIRSHYPLNATSVHDAADLIDPEAEAQR